MENVSKSFKLIWKSQPPWYGLHPR